MKTFKTTLITIIFISLLFVISFKCSDKQSQEKPASNSLDIECPNKYAKLIDDEIIIRFNECEAINNRGSIENLLKRLAAIGIFPKDTCECDSNLILFKDTDSVDPEERLAEVRDRIRAEGTNLGSAMNNLEVTIVDSTQVQRVNLKSYEGTKFSDTLIVAVLDGGISWSMFEPYMWKNESSIGTDHGFSAFEDTSPGFNHGNVVSYLIVEGMDASTLKLMDLRIFDDSGDGSLFDANCALSFAIQNSADVINTSWGYYNKKHDPTFFEYVKKASYNDIIVVSSAGNKGINTDNKCRHFPSGYDDQRYHHDAYNVISVAYLNASGDELHPESNRGKKSVSLAANGIHEIPIGDGSYSGVEGTSFAAPLVTKEIIKLKGKRTDLNHRHIMNCFLDQIPDDLELEVQTKGKLPPTINPTCE